MVAANHSRAREAMAKVEKAYAEGKLTRGQYLSQREQLHRMLQLPVMPKSRISQNAKGFFMKNLIDNSPAPVGYFNQNYDGRPTRKYHTFWNTSGGANQENIRAPTRRMAPINNVRASLLEMQKEEYWNWEGDLNNVLRKNMMSNNGLTNQSEVNQMNTNSHLSHYQDTQLQVNKQLGRLGVTKIDENNYPQVMQLINNQQEVQVALQNLLDSIERAVIKQINAGWNEQQAKASVISLARQAGAKLNAQGYDPEAARSIIARLVSGEITELGAIYAVAGDLKEAANIINGIGNNANGTMTANSGLFNNNMPLPSTAPPTSNAISAPVLSKASNASIPYASLDLPTLKQMYENAQNNAEAARIKQAINYRSEAMNAIKRGNSVNTIVAPSMQQSGAAAQRAVANNPALQYSRRATARQSPDVMLVVKDIMTIDGNLIFDYTAGQPIVINPDGSYEKYIGSMLQQNMLNEQVGMQIRPMGEWSILAKMMPETTQALSFRNRLDRTMKFGTQMLTQIKRDLNYALASPNWDDNARGYLIYLLNRTLEMIDKIENPMIVQSNANEVVQQNNVNQVIQQNNVNQVMQQNKVNQVMQQNNVNQVMQQNNIVQQNNPYANTYVQHKHWSPDGSGPYAAKTQEENNSLHSKGYTHNQPKTVTAQSQQQTSTNATGNSTATNRGGGAYTNKGQSNRIAGRVNNGGGAAAGGGWSWARRR